MMPRFLAVNHLQPLISAENVLPSAVWKPGFNVMAWLAW